MSDSVINVLSTVPATLESTKQMLESVITSGAQSVMLLVCEDTPLSTQDLEKLLKECPIPLFGGIFPSLILDGQVFQQGIIACTFNTALHIENIYEASSLRHISHQAQTLASKVLSHSPLFVFLDSSIRNIDAVLEELCAVCGNDHQYIGAGAGVSGMSLSQPCVLTNQGIMTDCVQVVGVNLQLSVAVKHGWQLLAGPLLVTDSSHGCVKSLDYKPALQMYKDTLREPLRHLDIDRMPISELAMHHPFGIARLDHEVVVRDPYMLEETSLVCLGDVPADHFIYILKGSKKKLLQASKEAASNLVASLAVSECIEPFFMFDCISRMQFLQEDFSQELQGVLDELPKNARLIGAVSTGEIANTNFACLELLNKAAVIGYFSR